MTLQGMRNPLDGLKVTQEPLAGANLNGIPLGGTFQYFLKVVPTSYTTLGNSTIVSNQYSVTEHFKEPIPGFNQQLPVRVRVSTPLQYQSILHGAACLVSQHAAHLHARTCGSLPHAFLNIHICVIRVLISPFPSLCRASSFSMTSAPLRFGSRRSDGRCSPSSPRRAPSWEACSRCLGSWMPPCGRGRGQCAKRENSAN